MAEHNQPGGFSMPMFKPWVPEKLRPWLYVYLAFTFQLSSGVYLGGLNEMMGSLSLMREDILMCLYASLCGLAFTFPILFRTKFRFTNRSLLLFSATGIAICNFIGLFVTCLPVLWTICFITGCLKIQGTFECMSNIQLWMTPKRDFRVFFPLLHIIIMLSIPMSDLLAVHLCHVATWHYMSYLMIGVMLFNVLWLFLCTRHFRFMKPLPFYAIDWLGAVLWVLTVMQAVYIFCYGEFYNWWDSETIRTLTVTTAITLLLAVVRMFVIRHPYLEPKMWKNKYLPGIFLLSLVIEAFFATEHVLEEVFYEGGMEWHTHTKAVLNYPVMLGVICASLFALLWLKVWQQGRVRLILIGLSVFIAYALCLYFTVSTDMNIEKLYLPMFLRGFAATLLSIVLLYSLQSVMHFMVFFQSLAVFQVLHLLIGGVIGAAGYAFGIRYLMADHVARYGNPLDNLRLPAREVPRHIGELMSQFQVASVKQLYGIVAYVAISVLLMIVLYDLFHTHNQIKRMPSWSSVGRILRRTVSFRRKRRFTFN
ncbi:MAG: hypothetical protein K2I90_01990 [Odoribacter sp.]|nr:hypothetical protein [Odoribacter sp.]